PGEGKALFETLGCSVCHETHRDGEGERPARATLKALGQKTTPAALANFLGNPGAVDAGGRMPAFAFANGDDPCRLAFYLTARDAAQEKPLSLPAAPDAAEVKLALADINLSADQLQQVSLKPLEQQIIELGRQVMRAKRCTACHEMKVPGEDDFWNP